jgi:hypothetical protein
LLEQLVVQAEVELEELKLQTQVTVQLILEVAAVVEATESALVVLAALVFVYY